jgi:hypothetical protein
MAPTVSRADRAVKGQQAAFARARRDVDRKLARDCLGCAHV